MDIVKDNNNDNNNNHNNNNHNIHKYSNNTSSNNRGLDKYCELAKISGLESKINTIQLRLKPNNLKGIS